MNVAENHEKEHDRGKHNSKISDADLASDDDGGGGSSGGLAGGNDISGNSGGICDLNRERGNCRVYISNIPYGYRSQDLEDLFSRIVGSVEYVELFHDENGKTRGCGIVEFMDPDNVQKALEEMNHYDVNGHELVVKEDHGQQREGCIGEHKAFNSSDVVLESTDLTKISYDSEEYDTSSTSTDSVAESPMEVPSRKRRNQNVEDIKVKMLLLAKKRNTMIRDIAASNNRMAESIRSYVALLTERNFKK